MHLVYNDIISLTNLCHAWREFGRGKRFKPDVMDFAHNLSANIYQLHEDLKNKTYCHGSYQHFRINDPKPRDIHKATVRDRLVHHALYRMLYIHFERLFIYDSYSCRVAKGTHRALNRFRRLAGEASESHSRTGWILKCDIRKFFASIDHPTLSAILHQQITDPDTLWLLHEIVASFSPGLPLGNLTSQLLVNVYMNEFDQFVKHELKVKYYLRYADDFVLLHHDRHYLLTMLPQIQHFLQTKLQLTLHPRKVTIKTLASGVDFLGWVHFPDHRVLRTATKRRMWRRLQESPSEATRQSHLGMLGWGNAYKIAKNARMVINERQADRAVD